MEDRCAVETWAEFGPSGSSPCTPRIKCGFETDVFLCTGSDEVYVFNPAERKLTVSYLMPAAPMHTDPQVIKITYTLCHVGLLQAVLQLPGPVSDLVVSHDNQLLYVSCTSGVYCINLPHLLSKYVPRYAHCTFNVFARIVVHKRLTHPHSSLQGSRHLSGCILWSSWAENLHRLPRRCRRRSVMPSPHWLCAPGPVAERRVLVPESVQNI